MVGVVVVVVIALSQCGGSDPDSEALADVPTNAATAEDNSVPAEPTEMPSVPAEAEEAADEVVEAEAPAAVPAPAPADDGYGELPADQAQFVSLAAAAQQAVQGAENDMQLAAAKAARDAGICSLLPARSVGGWSGKLVELDANGEGRGILTVEIAPGVEVATWNNFLSDSMDNTLIEPTSPVFASAASLAEGQMVRFSGEFVSGTGTDCLRESSMTLRGGIEDPNFIFRFSEVSAG